MKRPRSRKGREAEGGGEVGRLSEGMGYEEVARRGGSGEAPTEPGREANVPWESVLARCGVEGAARCAHPGRLPAGLECEVDGGGADDRGPVLEHLIHGPIRVNTVSK